MPAKRGLPSIEATKVLLFVFALLPCGILLWIACQDGLGHEPEKFVQRWTGLCTLNFLWLTLSISPLRRVTNQPLLGRYRRMLGLFTFFYASLHMLAFIGLEHDFAVDAIARAIFKQPYVMPGLAAFVLMLPLALSSNNGSIRYLGGRRWQALHRNIYPLSLIALAHYFWLSELSRLYWPITYSILLATLLAWRIDAYQRKALPRPPLGNAKPLRFFKQRPEK